MLSSQESQSISLESNAFFEVVFLSGWHSGVVELRLALRSSIELLRNHAAPERSVEIWHRYPESADLLWVPQKQVTRDLIDSQAPRFCRELRKHWLTFPVRKRRPRAPLILLSAILSKLSSADVGASPDLSENTARFYFTPCIGTPKWPCQG